jgi:hypothetical protein
LHCVLQNDPLPSVYTARQPLICELEHLPDDSYGIKERDVMESGCDARVEYTVPENSISVNSEKFRIK